MKLTSAAVFLTAFLSTHTAQASLIDFDAVAVPSGQCVDATNYLAGFGVTFTTGNPGATSAICTGSTTSTPVSPPNFFGVIPAPGQNNQPLSYTLHFADPLGSISLFRVGQVNPSTGPIWTATAFDLLNQVIGVPVGEPGITFSPPAQQFTIVGPAISSLRIESNNLAFASANNPGLDNFMLVRATVPEPSTVLLVLSGFGFAITRRRQHDKLTFPKDFRAGNRM